MVEASFFAWPSFMIDPALSHHILLAFIGACRQAFNDITLQHNKQCRNRDRDQYGACREHRKFGPRKVVDDHVVQAHGERQFLARLQHQLGENKIRKHAGKIVSDVYTMSGDESGRMTRKKTPKCEAPSILAASTRLVGIVSK